MQTVDALKRLHEQQEQELEIQNELLDSDDEEDIAARLNGVDLDDPDKVWDNLIESEKVEFEKLVESGEIAKYVPQFLPWWSYKTERPILIEELDERDKSKQGDPLINDLLSKIPKIDIESIGRLSKFLGDKKPSCLIKFNILNVLYAYAYSVNYFRGEHHEYQDQFVEMCLLLSSNLRANQNFDSSDIALESAASSVNQHSMISVSPEFTKAAKLDVFKIVRGPRVKTVGNASYQNIYILSALSDLKKVFKMCLKKAKKSGKEVETNSPKNREMSAILRTKTPNWKLGATSSLFLNNPRKIDLDLQVVKQATKKLDFNLAWTIECYDQFANNI